MPEEKKDFVVKDRRFFSEENQDSKEDKEEAPKEEAKTRLSENKKEPSKNDAGAETETQLPEINFATFIFSLHSSVLLQIGLIEDPVTGKKTKNLPAAKQTIDILAMLEEKTRGNLTKEEEGMLKNILYDLRMTFVRERE
ncbi:DUF1844 domain-containing protein [Desulfobacterales bacterium HSG2]|nr:DUF1844 domain-containing protein [Desulfobacterales bacterium HSG2]